MIDQYKISRVKYRGTKNIYVYKGDRTSKNHKDSFRSRGKGIEETNIQAIPQRILTSSFLVFFCSTQIGTVHRPGAAQGPVAELPHVGV